MMFDKAVSDPSTVLLFGASKVGFVSNLSPSLARRSLSIFIGPIPIPSGHMSMEAQARRAIGQSMWP